jgi:PAS domain S-box-containing protein
VIAIVQNTEDISDMVETSAQLKLAELQQANALATGLVGAWTWNLHDNVVVADPGVAKLFGMTAAETKRGMPIARFLESIHKDDRHTVKEQIALAIEKDGVYESEYRTVDRKGGIHWVIARGKLEYDASGEPHSFPGVMIDITDRKKAEEALQESETRLRFMADSMPQLVWIARPDGYHEYYNHQWYEYTGTNVGETDGKGWNALFHPDDQARARKRWQHSLKTGEPYEIEYRLYHAKTGVYRWVIGRALPFHDASGEIIKWYGTCTDIDDQKRNEGIQSFLAEASRELASSLDYNAMLKKITKLSVPTLADWCSIDLYDETKGFTQVAVAHRNPKKVTLARQYRKNNPITIDDPRGAPKVVRTGKSEFYPVIDMALIKKYVKDKEKVDFFASLDLCSMMIVPIFINNKPAGAISFASSDSHRHFTDADLQVAEGLAGRLSLSITNAKLYEDSLKDIERRHELEEELKREKGMLESRVQERTKQLQLTNDGLHKEIVKRQSAEKELHAYSKELARSNQELQDFAYVSSHDLQEPLRKIQAFGNLLESEHGDKLGDGLDYLVRMQGAASRMSTLIQDLLAFSRVSTQPNTRADVDLNSVIADVVSDLEMRVADTKATVKIGKMPHVIADPTHMRQLFQNLIGNALKFHRPDVLPVVEVSATTTKQHYEIRVKDNGIGFDVKYLDRIFAVFQRLHGREAYEGTGIGLAVCRKIVERYNGTITAESQKNSGSVFIVRLPIGGGGHKI